jgi:peptidoglycan L-alanyl-D-glutamate endopeptidase CwlK
VPLGKDSLRHLATCHVDLRKLIICVAAGIDEGDLAYAGVMDISVLCGYRGEEEQNKAVADGASETPWPRSKHNRMPSDAVDVVPYPIRWKDPAWVKSLEALHAYVAGVAHALGIDLYDISWDRPHIQRNVP